MSKAKNPLKEAQVAFQAACTAYASVDQDAIFVGLLKDAVKHSIAHRNPCFFNMLGIAVNTKRSHKNFYKNIIVRVCAWKMSPADLIVSEGVPMDAEKMAKLEDATSDGYYEKVIEKWLEFVAKAKEPKPFDEGAFREQFSRFILRGLKNGITLEQEDFRQATAIALSKHARAGGDAPVKIIPVPEAPETLAETPETLAETPKMPPEVLAAAAEQVAQATA